MEFQDAKSGLMVVKRILTMWIYGIKIGLPVASPPGCWTGQVASKKWSQGG